MMNEEILLEKSIRYSWSGYKIDENNKSLLSLMDSASEQFLQKLNKFISVILVELENNSYNERTKLLFYASSLVEKSPFKSDAWKNALRLIVFEHELDTSEFSEFTYRGPDPAVKQSLRGLSQKRGMSFKWQSVRLFDDSSWLRYLFKRLPLWLRAQIHLFRYLLKHWSLRKLTDPQWSSGENTLFLFSYFIHLDEERAQAGHFYSKQWEKLPQHLLASGFRLNWGHLFLTSSLIPNTQTAINWVSRFQQNSEKQGTHALLDQYLDWKILVRVLADWIYSVSFYLYHLRNKSSKLDKLGQSWLLPLFQKDLEDSWTGPVSIQNILWSHLFDKMLGSLPKQQVGLYLMENQGWERIFLYFWRKHRHGTIIGVPHTTIRYWDLRYFDFATHKSLADLPQPDLVAVNGEHAWQMLQQSGYPMERCVSVEALRYQYLSELKPVDLQKAPKKINRLLVLGDVKSETTHRMLFELERVSNQLEEKVDIWIKPHPGNPVDLDKYPILSAVLKEKFLAELFSEVSVVMASIFTAASLDAYCAGLPVITYLDPNEFNFSPLRCHPNARFASSGEDMLRFLQDSHWLSTSPGAEPSNFFWLDEQLPRWTQLIQATFAEHSKVND